MHENSKNSFFTVGLRSGRVPAQRHSDREIGRLSGNDLKYQVIFCKSVDRVRDATWQPGCVLLWFSARAINLDVFDNLWCARSVNQEFSHAWTVPCISAPCSCCTESQCLLSGHFCCCMHFVWYYSVLGKFMMSKLWILNWDLILNFLHAFCMVLVL